MNVREFLTDRDVTFEAMQHSPTYDAQRLAGAVHVCGDEVAKTVLLRADEDWALAVLPATRSVDLARCAEALNCVAVDLASEDECGQRFADCELGALPPFGSQYGLKTLMDRSLLEDEEIVFEGNSHHEAIRLRTRDYLDIEQPVLGEFTYGF